MLVVSSGKMMKWQDIIIFSLIWFYIVFRFLKLYCLYDQKHIKLFSLWGK